MSIRVLVADDQSMVRAGFRMLLVLYRTLATRSGRVVLVGLSDDIRDTMEMTGFLQFFQVETTVAAGLAVLQDTGAAHVSSR